MRSSSQATRSLSPDGSKLPDIAHLLLRRAHEHRERIASAAQSGGGFRQRPGIGRAPADARRARRLAAASSRLLASQTVQVTSDAKTRPIITIFTTMSAFMNMPQGDRSRGKVAAPTEGRLGAAAGCAGRLPEAASPVAGACAGVSGAAGASGGVGGGGKTDVDGFGWANVGGNGSTTAVAVTATSISMAQQARSERARIMCVIANFQAFPADRSDPPATAAAL